MDISELSKLTGIAASKLRYYEKRGLIKSIGRSGLKRVFPKGIVINLSFISLAQSCGFSLVEISKMFDRNNRFKLKQKSLNSKIDEVNARINELKNMRATLVHLTKCPEEDHFHCPNFKKLLHKALLLKNIKNKF
jgi:DNA-binding transcriptional MerR regulator